MVLRSLSPLGNIHGLLYLEVRKREGEEIMDEERTYRIEIILQGFDNDGFWDLFRQSEILYTNKEFEESLEDIVVNCRKYMKNRVK